MKKMSNGQMNDDGKIIIQSDELKKKVRIRVPKNAALSSKGNTTKATRRNVSLEKGVKLGTLSKTTSKKSASDFRKKSANWRDGAKVDLYDSSEKMHEQQITNNYEESNLIYDEETFFERMKAFSPIQWAAVGMAVVVFVTSIMTTGVYASYKGEQNKAIAFAQLPSYTESSNSQLAYAKEEVAEEPEPEALAEPEEVQGSVLSLVMTSVEKDLKIKLVDEEDTLVKGVAWGVTVADKDNNQSSYDDEDTDGIIHLTDISAGDYSVTLNSSDSLSGYTIPSTSSRVSVKAKVEYKVIANIKEEIKSEKEVNVAAEDANGNQAADVETGTPLTDTVEFVESTKTENGDAYVLSSVDLSKCEKAAVNVKDYIIKAIRLFASSTKKSANGLALVRLVADVIDHEHGNYLVVEPSDDTHHTVKCGIDNCEYTKTVDCDFSSGDACACGNKKASQSCQHSNTKYESSGGGKHKKVCSDCNAVLVESENCSGDTKCSLCGADMSSSSCDHSAGKFKYLSNNNGTHKKTCEGCNGTVSESEACTYENNKCKYCGYSKADNNVAVTGVKLDQTALSIVVGKTATLKATIEPSNATNQSVTWTSSNESVAKVSGGTITGVAAGTATVTVKTTDGTKSDTCVVTVTSNAVKYKESSKLYDSQGNLLYKKDGDNYVEATYKDYLNNNSIALYKKDKGYLYTGWQTIGDKTYYYKKDNTYVTGEQVIGGVLYHFASDGSLTQGSGTLGIDVSKYQPSINWESVKASGVSFVIIRCGYRGASTGALIQDPYFTSHIKGAKAAGLKVGIYFFSTALTEAEAVEEASMCAALCSGYGINYPVFIDVESSSRPGYNSLPAAQRTANIKAFCSTIKSAGYTPGVYANKTWFTSYINTSQLSGYKIWLAQYNSAGPTYTGRYDLWQYTSKGSVNGISGNVDMNQSYLGY